MPTRGKGQAGGGVGVGARARGGGCWGLREAGSRGGSVERLAALDFLQVPRGCRLRTPSPALGLGSHSATPCLWPGATFQGSLGPAGAVGTSLILPPAVIAQGPHQQLVLFYAKPLGFPAAVVISPEGLRQEAQPGQH